MLFYKFCSAYRKAVATLKLRGEKLGELIQNLDSCIQMIIYACSKINSASTLSSKYTALRKSISGFCLPFMIRESLASLIFNFLAKSFCFRCSLSVEFSAASLRIILWKRVFRLVLIVRRVSIDYENWFSSTTDISCCTVSAQLLYGLVYRKESSDSLWFNFISII